MRSLQGSSDTALDQSMGRKAARLARKPHVVGSVALDQRLRDAGGGGGVVDPERPTNITAPVLTLSGDESTFTYIRGTWDGAPPPVLRGQIYDADDDTVFATNQTPGTHPTPPEWSGRRIALDEYASNGFTPIPRASSEAIYPGATEPESESESEPQSDSSSPPWDAFTTHAQIDDWAAAQGFSRAEDWGRMNLDAKRKWLVDYFDGATPWATGN